MFHLDISQKKKRLTGFVCRRGGDLRLNYTLPFRCARCETQYVCSKRLLRQPS
ncbi:hypothetical protein F511_47339 [Dorcoceras hygrometricum]|uniref:Uncharacterized protein n=1 Tax=Dorcoceras hygrometricum TaxID=472368 RepID=A0A2Z6ZR81_9LAMI|nr:hypothetical protein F511_47339 [Dorcoceras hygrometricum]